MVKSLRTVAFAAICSLVIGGYAGTEAYAADPAVKREMRSAGGHRLAVGLAAVDSIVDGQYDANQCAEEAADDVA